MVEDVGVSQESDCLLGKNILLIVSGGIAATESIKLARELRRHGAIVSPLMTSSAEKIISPISLSWGSGFDVITDWDPKMPQLGKFDGLVLAPATRNTIAKFVHGVLDSPAMMALSAASGNGMPMMFVPSMHNDIFDDPVTGDLLESVSEMGVKVFYDDSKEGRRKQPDPASIVANFSNFLNSSLEGRKRVAITLGANRAPIDSIRYVQNTSTGETGWSIAEHLHMMGHEVICITGNTTRGPKFKLPDIRLEDSPSGMLNLCLELAKCSSRPEVWIHSAAVLDYAPRPEQGKMRSGKDAWDLSLYPTKNHISELSNEVSGTIRIGFKLEVEQTQESLIEIAKSQIADNNLDAVVANLLSESLGEGKNRCRIVFSGGDVIEIETIRNLSESIDKFISSTN